MAIPRLASTLLVAMVFAASNTLHERKPNEPESLSGSNTASVEAAVRNFMAGAARDVTQEGPLAWSKYFEDSPAFFMAVNGQMAFPNGTAAKDGIRNVAVILKHVELEWGDDLRIDPVGPGLAITAASWREKQIDSAGHQTEESGFFTGLAEFRDGRWQFRNAHWSSPVPPPPPSKKPS